MNANITDYAPNFSENFDTKKVDFRFLVGYALSTKHHRYD